MHCRFQSECERTAVPCTGHTCACLAQQSTNSKVVAHFTSNEQGNGGVATVIKKTFLETLDNFLVHEVHPDECQHITFAFQGTQFSYANVHMSQNGAERGALCIKMAGALPIGTIVGGDFNMVQDPDEDTYRPHSTRPYDNGGWQEMMAMQVSLQLHDLWRETKGDSRLYTHISSTHTGTTKTRIDYVLCPHGATVGPYGLATDHDYTFWQGTGRADHLGVTLTVQPVEMTPPKSKRHAISPHMFETHGWNELHNIYGKHTSLKPLNSHQCGSGGRSGRPPSPQQPGAI